MGPRQIVGGEAGVTAVSGSGAGTQVEPKPTDGGTYLCLLQIFFLVIFPLPKAILCIIFGQCLTVFCSCYFCYWFFFRLSFLPAAAIGHCIF